MVFVLSVAAILYEIGKQKKLVNQLHCVSCMLHKFVTDVLLPLSDSARMAYYLLLANVLFVASAFLPSFRGWLVSMRCKIEDWIIA